MKPPADVAFDGEDLSGTLLGTKPASQSAPIFWRQPDRKSWPPQIPEPQPDLAVRNGQWKLLCDYDGSRTRLRSGRRSRGNRRRRRATNRGRPTTRRRGGRVASVDAARQRIENSRLSLRGRKVLWPSRSATRQIQIFEHRRTARNAELRSNSAANKKSQSLRESPGSCGAKPPIPPLNV